MAIQEDEPIPDVRRRSTARPLLGAIAVLTVLTFLFTTFMSSFWLFVFVLCLLSCIGAMGLNLLMGTTGLVSVGSAGFLAIGGFSVVIFEGQIFGVPLGLVAGPFFAALAGIVVGLPALRIWGLELALATLAAHFIILHFAIDYQERDPFTASAGFLIDPLFISKGFDAQVKYFAWLLLGIVSLVMAVTRILMRGRSGRALRMVRDHPAAAASLGVRVERYKILMFAVSSAFFGFQGALAALFSGSVAAENYTLTVAIQLVAMIVIGGLDSMAGAIVGAFVVTSLPFVLPDVLSLFISDASAATNGPQIAQILYGILIGGFVVSASGGLVGLARASAYRVRGLLRLGKPSPDRGLAAER